MSDLPHETRPIKVWIDADVSIADMVLYLNTIPGVRTQASCQGTLGMGGSNPYGPQVLCSWDDNALAILQTEFDVTPEGNGSWGYIRPHKGWSAPQRTIPTLNPAALSRLAALVDEARRLAEDVDPPYAAKVLLEMAEMLSLVPVVLQERDAAISYLSEVLAFISNVRAEDRCEAVDEAQQWYNLARPGQQISFDVASIFRIKMECADLDGTFKSERLEQAEAQIAQLTAALEPLVELVMDARGYRYATDPMEFGQDAYDITNSCRDEIRKILDGTK